MEDGKIGKKKSWRKGDGGRSIGIFKSVTKSEVSQLLPPKKKENL